MPPHFRFLTISCALALSFSLLVGSAVPSQAQLFSRPPAQVGGDDGYGGGDAAQQQVRIDRLENQVRTLNGQIEQLQFAQRRLEDMLKKFQQDVDFRFQDQAGGKGGAGSPPRQRRSELDDSIPGAGDVAVAGAGGVASGVVADAGGRRRGDAFDPAQNPTAPGAPRQLGQLPGAGSGGPVSSRDPAAPMDLTGGYARHGAPPATPVYNTPPPASSLGARPIGVVPPGSRADVNDGQPGVIAAQIPPGSPPTNYGAPTGTVMAGLPPTGTKEEFDLALVSYNNGQMDAAEAGFRGFASAHPRDRLVPDAVFYLGETYWKRGRAREAAEQYLKVSTDYAKSSRAPESLVKLGLALEKLGAKEQACATWGEVGRKYPTASATVRNAALRESKRLAC